MYFQNINIKLWRHLLQAFGEGWSSGWWTVGPCTAQCLHWPLFSSRPNEVRHSLKSHNCHMYHWKSRSVKRKWRKLDFCDSQTLNLQYIKHRAIRYCPAVATCIQGIFSLQGNTTEQCTQCVLVLLGSEQFLVTHHSMSIYEDKDTMWTQFSQGPVGGW